MVVSENQINNIMGGMQQSSAVRLNNHKHKLRHRFDIVKKLGQGTYGKVQLAINKETGQDVAIKTIKKAKIETEKDLVRIRREIQIMSSVTHPHIIHIFEVFENRDKMVLVMEYAAGGELYDYLSEKKVLSESDARRIFRQVASACYYCHKHKICHRDLKLENILLDEYGNAKIADFGLSNVFDDSRLLSTYCGSPLYASPEIVRGTPYVGPEVDCWSLGVLLYTLVYGAMPFDGSNFKKLVKQITAGDFYEPSKKSPASELIHALLTAAPDRRATMVDVCGHWWVNQGEELPCLEAAEELANQTPVRLDLLLSLAPQGDKEHVLVPLPDEVIAPLVPGKEPTQFGASDSLSLGSAIELDPASSQAAPPTPGQAAPTEQAEPGADKAAKRTLDESEEPVAPAKKTDKAKKRVAEKKKKKPAASSAPAPAPEDVPMKDVAAAGQETEAPATGGRVEPQEVGPAGTGEMEVMPAAEERPPPPAEAAPRSVEAQPTPVRPAEEEKVAPAVDDAGGKQQGGQAVGAQDVPSPAGDVETASRSEGDDEASAPAADVQSEGKSKGDEKSADSEQLIVPPPPSEDVTAKSRSPSADRRSITPSEDKLREAAVREEKTIGASPEADESKDVPKPSEPKPRDAKEAVLDKEKEGRKQDVSISVAEVKKDTDIVPRGLKSPQKESLPSKTEIVVVSEDDEGIADKPKESAELPEHRRKQSSPKHEGEAAASPKKSKIPVKDAKSAESIAKNKVSQATDDAQGPSRLSPAADAKKTVASKSKDKVPAVPKPEKAADVKRDVQPEAKKQTVEQDKDTRTPEKPGDKKTPPQEKPKHKEEKPEEKVKATPAKAEEKTKEKLAKPEEKASDKLAKPKPSLKMPERRSPARSSADSLPSSIRTAPADERPLPTAPQPAPAAKARLNRVFSDGERQEPPAAPAAPQPERSQSLPPRRAASKEFIIPIRLADGEEVKPASPAPAAAAPAAPAPAAPTAPAARAAPAPRRPSKPVAPTTSLRSLPESSSEGEEEPARPSPPREAIRKSPREFIIPIALEGGGTMTPPARPQSEDAERAEGSGLFRSHQLSGQRRLGSLLGERAAGEQDWDAPWGLRRLTSMRCFDDRRLPSLGDWPASRRMSRPKMASSSERADSLSSGGEEDDEDDQFEIFTAESLFGSLMDRVKNLSKRMDVNDSPGKRCLLLSDPLRLSQSGPQRQRMPGLWGVHGQVRSLFDKPMTFPHGSLFDQPAFARHSSFGSQPAAESSDSGSQQEDSGTTTETRTKTRVKKTSTPPKTRLATISFKIKPRSDQ